jgi:hypothetical protein
MEQPDPQNPDPQIEPGSDEDDRPQESPIPPDAPVETPEADPRTEQAPDGGGARDVNDTSPRAEDPSSPASTEEQIQQAFE